MPRIDPVPTVSWPAAVELDRTARHPAHPSSLRNGLGDGTVGCVGSLGADSTPHYRTSFPPSDPSTESTLAPWFQMLSAQIAATLFWMASSRVSLIEAGFPAGSVPTRRGFLKALGQSAAAMSVRSANSQIPGQPLRQRTARVVLDSDAANYFDDQFALAYAALSRKEIVIEALYAAPFTNQRTATPHDGMKRSHAEIERVLETLGIGGQIPVLAGATDHMQAADHPVESPAAQDIVDRVMRPASPVDHVVSIGPATNVASALAIEPAIRQRVTVVWLGGTPHHTLSASEFNLRQDVHAARALFDSGVRLIQVPAPGVAEHLRTTEAEIAERIRGSSAIGTYLADLVAAHTAVGHGPTSSSRAFAVWDLAAVAWLVNPGWVPSVTTSSPSLSRDLEWLHNSGRPQMRVATGVLRDEIFEDLFRKLGNGPR